jgi:hypothetical protein
LAANGELRKRFALPGLQGQNLLRRHLPLIRYHAACAYLPAFLLETVAGFFARGTVKKALIIARRAAKNRRIWDWNGPQTLRFLFGDVVPVACRSGAGGQFPGFDTDERRRGKHHPHPALPGRIAVLETGIRKAFYPHARAGNLQVCR